MKNLIAFICGGIFALGLMLSGMSNPAVVQSFFDVFGDWSPRLMFVMGGAVLVSFYPFQRVMKQEHPQTFFHEPIDLPKSKLIDSRLIVGSILFGIGWGLSGICPAPALTLLGLGHWDALYFIVPMLLGMFAYKLTQK